MNKETFDKFQRSILQKASRKRAEKEKEYFSEVDVLGSLRKIARFRNKETPVGIMNLLAKPLQSLSEMVDFEFGGTPEKPNVTVIIDELPSPEQWDEKFIDSINYLLKLYASIREERG